MISEIIRPSEVSERGRVSNCSDKYTTRGISVRATRVNCSMMLEDGNGDICYAERGDWVVTLRLGCKFVLPDWLFREMFAQYP